MKLETIQYYFDTEKNTYLEAGTILDVSAERGKILVDAKVAKEIKEEKEVKKKKSE